MITQQQYDEAIDKRLTAIIDIEQLKAEIEVLDAIINEFEKQEEPF
jgi:hypothetical protein